MKKLIGVLFLCITISMQAQYVRPGDETSPPPPEHISDLPINGFADHLSLGGSFILQFGQYTVVELEPLLSYHFNPSFMVGFGPIYQYESLDASIYGYGLTASAYGGRVSALYFLPDDLSKIFIMGEFDVINVPEPSPYSYQVGRGYLSLPMAGLGYKEPVSSKAFFCVYVLWNFNNSLYNPFTNPVINFGFDIGLWR